MKAKSKFFNPTSFWLLLIIFLGGFFRFYKLDWGEGYFFHPDEYHIVAAVNRLNFPIQMNPKLFSYGSFIVYLNYFTKTIFGNANPFLIGRFYSAFFSTLTIYLIYFISTKLFKERLPALIAALLAAITPGLIQQAHFATPESTLTFWLFFTIYLWVWYLSSKRLIFLFGSSVTLGFAMGTKIAGLTFLPILTIFPFMSIKLRKKDWKINVGKFLRASLTSLSLLITTFISFFLVFPYSILDWKSFRGTTIYETSLGRGKRIAFYTRQFIDTIPFVFQATRVLPYALGIVLFIVGTLGFGLAVWEVAKSVKSKKPNLILLMMVFSFILFFVSNAILFTKWTRFIAPSFPFWSIFASYFIYKISLKTKKKFVRNRIACALIVLTVFPTFIWTLMFFSIYIRHDVRVTATNWVNKNLSTNSFILTEAGNMMEVPLSGKPKKMAFDFYHLDKNRKLQLQLPKLLADADYFIIQSRRMYKNHQRLPKMFPVTSNFYDQLFSGNLGFAKIREFDSYPQLVIGHWSLVIPDEIGEETWSVFDHPVIRIYKKVKPFTKNQYEKILKI
jgi:hypothetical protein